MARGVRYTISSDFDNKGVRAAEKGIIALGKSALKATVGITSASMAVQNLNRFLQESVQAALADEKAYKVLGQTLQSAGFTQATEGVKNFIDAQQLATGVAEDQLIPAYTTLFNALQSVAKAQDTLQLAQSVAIATGKDLSAVTSAFAKAAVGSTTSLQRLGIGISKAELAAGDFDSILRKLERRFGSTTAAAINTTAVRIDRLKVAVGEAKEEVGKGLVDAFDLLAREGGQDIDALQTKIISMGTTIGDFARGVGVVAGKLREVANIQIAGGSLLSTMLKISPSGFIWSKIAEQLVKVGEAERQTSARQNLRGFGSQVQARQEKAAEVARAKEIARLKAIERAKQLAAAAELARKRAAEAQEKKRKELEKQINEVAKQFDIERISIAAALSRQQDATTQSRLKALMLLNDLQYAENDSLSEMQKLLDEINRLQGLLNARTAEGAVNVMKIYEAYKLTGNELVRLSELYKNAQPGSPAQFRLGERIANSGNALPVDSPNIIPGSENMNPNRWMVQGTNATNNYYITGSLIAQQDLEAAIAGATNSAARSGVAYSQIFSRL